MSARGRARFTGGTISGQRAAANERTFTRSARQPRNAAAAARAGVVTRPGRGAFTGRFTYEGRGRGRTRYILAPATRSASGPGIRTNEQRFRRTAKGGSFVNVA